MTSPPTPKPKITDAERHKRFVEAAKKVGASSNPKDFDKAFERVAARKNRQPPTKVYS